MLFCGVLSPLKAYFLFFEIVSEFQLERRVRALRAMRNLFSEIDNILPFGLYLLAIVVLGHASTLPNV